MTISMFGIRLTENSHRLVNVFTTDDRWKTRVYSYEPLTIESTQEPKELIWIKVTVTVIDIPHLLDCLIQIQADTLT